MKPKRTPRADTYALPGGGILHIDKILVPIILEPLALRCEKHQTEHYKGTMCRKCYEEGPWKNIEFTAMTGDFKPANKV